MDERCRTVYQELKAVARRRATVEYGHLARLVGLDLGVHQDLDQLSAWLCEINEIEHAQDRPMLSAVAMNDENEVGGGFFKCARRLGHRVRDRVAFHANQLGAVHDLWSGANAPTD